MPLDRRELAERIAGAGSQDLLRGSIFRAVLAEVERRVPEHPQLPSLRARHGGRTIRDLNYYPAAEWLELLWDACDLLEPVLGGPEAALEACGESVCRYFLDSLVGKLAVALGGHGGPLERLMHAPMVYSAGASYGQRVPVRLDATHGRITIHGDFAPVAYHVGLLRAGLQRAGHPMKIVGRQTGLLSCEIDVEVEPR